MKMNRTWNVTAAVVAAMCCLVTPTTAIIGTQGIGGVIREDATGEALPAVRVSAAVDGRRYETDTSSDGRFVFHDLAVPGAIDLTATLTGYLSVNLRANSIGPAEPVEVRMSKLGVIAGRVGGGGTGHIVATRTGSVGAGTTFRGQISRSGQFRFYGLPIGRYLLALVNPSSTTYGAMKGAWSAESLTLPMELVILGNSVHENLDARLPILRPGRITGRVASESGLLAKTVVSLVSDLEASVASHSTVVSPQGLFSIENVIPGRYTLLATPLEVSPDVARQVFAYSEVEIGSGSEAHSDLLLQSARSRVVTVRRSGSADQEFCAGDVKVDLKSRYPWRASGQVSAVLAPTIATAAILTPPGPLTAVFSSADGQCFGLVEQQSEQLVATLLKTGPGSLRGVLPESNKDAVVLFAAEGGTSIGALRAAGGGLFSIANVAPGKYFVSVVGYGAPWFPAALDIGEWLVVEPNQTTTVSFRQR